MNGMSQLMNELEECSTHKNANNHAGNVFVTRNIDKISGFQ